LKLFLHTLRLKDLDLLLTQFSEDQQFNDLDHLPTSRWVKAKAHQVTTAFVTTVALAKQDRYMVAAKTLQPPPTSITEVLQ
jgi:hypothetical protein